jgi:hypothetical protein
MLRLSSNYQICLVFCAFLHYAISSSDYAGRMSIKLKTNSVAQVLERSIPTERPYLVGEVSANFCG